MGGAAGLAASGAGGAGGATAGAAATTGTITFGFSSTGADTGVPEAITGEAVVTMGAGVSTFTSGAAGGGVLSNTGTTAGAISATGAGGATGTAAGGGGRGAEITTIFSWGGAGLAFSSTCRPENLLDRSGRSFKSSTSKYSALILSSELDGTFAAVMPSDLALVRISLFSKPYFFAIS